MYHVYINRDIIYLSIFLFSILIERFPHDTSLLREEGEEAEGEPQDGPEAEGGSVEVDVITISSSILYVELALWLGQNSRRSRPSSPRRRPWCLCEGIGIQLARRGWGTAPPSLGRAA